MKSHEEPVRLDVEVGDSVLARWPGTDTYFVGTAVEKDGSDFRIVFEDGDIGVVSRSEVFRNDIAVGRRVCARWKNGSYYPGTVARIVGVALYVHHAAGDERWVPFSGVAVKESLLSAGVSRH